MSWGKGYPSKAGGQDTKPQVIPHYFQGIKITGILKNFLLENGDLWDRRRL
jgi:hypothetical protein